MGPGSIAMTRHGETKDGEKTEYHMAEDSGEIKIVKKRGHVTTKIHIDPGLIEWTEGDEYLDKIEYWKTTE